MTFVATQSGEVQDGATYGNTSPGTAGVDYPGATDSLDLAGYALTSASALTLVAIVDTAGGGSLDLADDLTAGSVTNVSITVISHKLAGTAVACLSVFGTSTFVLSGFSTLAEAQAEAAANWTMGTKFTVAGTDYNDGDWQIAARFPVVKDSPPRIEVYVGSGQLINETNSTGTATRWTPIAITADLYVVNDGVSSLLVTGVAAIDWNLLVSGENLSGVLYSIGGVISSITGSIAVDTETNTTVAAFYGWIQRWGCCLTTCSTGTTIQLNSGTYIDHWEDDLLNTGSGIAIDLGGANWINVFIVDVTNTGSGTAILSAGIVPQIIIGDVVNTGEGMAIDFSASPNWSFLVSTMPATGVAGPTQYVSQFINRRHIAAAADVRYGTPRWTEPADADNGTMAPVIIED